MNLTVLEKEFLENASIKLEDFEKAKIDVKLLIDIAEDYKNFYSDFLQEAEYIAQKLQRCKAVHSVRWRVKDVGHLIEKIIRKRCEEKVAAKYKDISVENYKSVITDLIGVRAIHLFKDDWYKVHQHILSNWKPNERVTVYFRDGDNIAMFSGHKCKTVKHKAGYRSIHYIVPVNKIDNNKVACEIQTRTLFEEGWSEIDHRVRYPNFLDDENLKKYLDIFNRLAGSADEMGSYVNSLVELINLNQEYNLKIHLLEGKVDKLLQENAEADVIRKAFKELKHTYEMKEELLKQERYIINGKKSIVPTNMRSILKQINDKNIDVSSLMVSNYGSGAHVTLIDENGKRITLPTFFINDLEKYFNIKIKT